MDTIKSIANKILAILWEHIGQKIYQDNLAGMVYRRRTERGGPPEFRQALAELVMSRKIVSGADNDMVWYLIPGPPEEPEYPYDS